MTLAGLGLQELGLFMAATLVLNATPGVDLLLTVARTLQAGARAGVAVVLGIAAGCVVHTLAAAFGLAALLALSPRAFLALQWAGAGYLLWLALGLARSAWRGPVAAARASAQGTPSDGATGGVDRRPVATHFRAGLVTNVLNPKVALFFLAFLPQFIGVGVNDKTQAFLLLGLLFVLQSLVFMLALVAVTAQLQRWSRRQSPPVLTRVLEGAGAALFALLAWRLLGVRAG